MTEKRLQLTVLFQKMADLTAPECGKRCRCSAPTRCCDPMYCSMAIDHAAEFWNEDISDLMDTDQHIPFLSSSGCIIAPHLRPLCTLHTCEINAHGVKRNDPDWTERYFKLRDKIDELTGEIGKEEGIFSF